jgi:hypothetical protein
MTCRYPSVKAGEAPVTFVSPRRLSGETISDLFDRIRSIVERKGCPSRRSDVILALCP